MFLLADLVIFVVCKKSNQSVLAMSLQLKFAGEYCQNGGAWQTLDEGTDLSAFDGDLSLRGTFDTELPEGVCIYFYLDHIGMTVSVNGENLYDMSNEINPDMCGTGWQGWLLPAMAEGDQVEIQLHNPHRYGNKNAYNELLDSLYVSGETQLKQLYKKERNALSMFLCLSLCSVHRPHRYSNRLSDFTSAKQHPSVEAGAHVLSHGCVYVS